jgi:hypothetical protein
MKNKKRYSDLNWCEGDYKHQHCWERIGVVHLFNNDFVYYRCSQCEKWKRAKIEFVFGGGYDRE